MYIQHNIIIDYSRLVTIIIKLPNEPSCSLVGWLVSWSLIIFYKSKITPHPCSYLYHFLEHVLYTFIHLYIYNGVLPKP